MDERDLAKKLDKVMSIVKGAVFNFNNLGNSYIYAYLDPFKPALNKWYQNICFEYEPFYIGKGTGNRMYDHIKVIKGIKKRSPVDGNDSKFNKIKKIFKKGGEPIIIKLAIGLDDMSANALEQTFITLIGRRDLKKGPLTNLTNGGDGASGIKNTKGFCKGHIPWNKGVPMKLEAKLHLSEKNKGKKKSIPNTEFQRQNASRVHKNKIVSIETRLKSSLSHKGNVPWNKGKKAIKPSWNKGLRGIRRKEYQFLLNDEVIVNISDLRNYCKELNISYPSMLEVFRGERTEYRNYKSI